MASEGVLVMPRKHARKSGIDAQGDALLRYCGEQLRRAREAKEWTQSDVAQRLGTSIARISEIERGESGTSLGRLLHLAKIVELPLHFLFPPDQDFPYADFPSLWAEASPDMREVIYDLLKKFRGFRPPGC